MSYSIFHHNHLFIFCKILIMDFKKIFLKKKDIINFYFVGSCKTNLFHKLLLFMKYEKCLSIERNSSFLSPLKIPNKQEIFSLSFINYYFF